MKFQLGKIVHPEFQKSLAKLAEQDLPIRILYKLKSVVKVVGEETKKYEEIREERAAKYAAKAESGSPIVEEKEIDGRRTMVFKMSDEGMGKFSVDMKELAEQEIDLEEINLHDFGAEVKLNTKDLLALEFIKG